MKNDIARILIRFRDGELFLNETCDKILSLMGENEVGVSDAPEVKHGVLHDVGESHASGETTTLSEHTSGAALEKRTSDENDFYCENGGYGCCLTQCNTCYNEETGCL